MKIVFLRLDRRSTQGCSQQHNEPGPPRPSSQVCRPSHFNIDLLVGRDNRPSRCRRRYGAGVGAEVLISLRTRAAARDSALSFSYAQNRGSALRPQSVDR
jgi:hypothetical protein